MTSTIQRVAEVVPEPVRPSTSTVASGAGGAVAVILLWLVETYLTGPLPAPVSASIATLVVIGTGYFFYGGRSADTK